MSKHRFLSAALAAVLLGGAAFDATAAELTKASLRLKWLVQSGYAGFYVAQAKGYFKEEGLDLTINPGGPNILAENMVATGADTFGLSGGSESVLAARDKNLPVVAFGMTHQLTPFVFVAKKDGPVNTIEDFRGKKATAWFTGSHLVLYGMLEAKGIQKSELSIQPQQVSVTPFVEDQVDIVAATWYNELLTIQSRVGADKLRLFVPEDFGVTIPRDTLIVSEKFMAEKPELVQGFLRATIRGWQDVFKDPKGAVDTVMKIAPTLEREHQEKALKEAMRLMTAGEAKTKGLFYLDPVALQKAHDLLLKAQVMQKPVDLAKAFDSRFLNAIPLQARLVAQ